MPFDPHCSRYTIEEMGDMREERKQVAERKRERMRQEIQPDLDRFEELFGRD